MGEVTVHWSDAVQPGEITALFGMSDEEASNLTDALQVGLPQSAAARESAKIRVAGVDFDIPTLDGTQDCSAAINAQLKELNAAGGGTIVLPNGTYGLSAPIGLTSETLERITLIGACPRGVKWHYGNGALDDSGRPWKGGAYLKIIDGSDATDVITGTWHSCTIKDLAIDANGRGGIPVRADLSWTVIERCEIVGYTSFGMWLGEGRYNGGKNGFLNRIQYCNFSDTGYEGGAAIRVQEKFIDSWILYNNIEAGPGYAGIQTYSGGPLRIIGNHINGNRSPKYNIFIDNGIRECLIANNILEGAREHAILITAPSWKTEPERQSINIVGNIIREFSQDGVSDGTKFCAISADMTGQAGFVAGGLVISSNVISTDYPSDRAVMLKNWDGVAMVGNYWQHAVPDGSAPVWCELSMNVEAVGNAGFNVVAGPQPVN